MHYKMASHHVTLKRIFGAKTGLAHFSKRSHTLRNPYPTSKSKVTTPQQQPVSTHLPINLPSENPRWYHLRAVLFDNPIVREAKEPSANLCYCRSATPNPINRNHGKSPRIPSPCWKGQVSDTKGTIIFNSWTDLEGVERLRPKWQIWQSSFDLWRWRIGSPNNFTMSVCWQSRWQVEPQEKKKVPKGRAKKRIQYTRRFVNVTLTGGKRKVRTP